MSKADMRLKIEQLKGDLAYERQKVAELEKRAKDVPNTPGWVPLVRLDEVALQFKQFFRAVDQEIFTDEDIEKARKALEPYSWDYFRLKGLIQ